MWVAVDIIITLAHSVASEFTFTFLAVSHSLSLSYPHPHIADDTWTLKSFCGKLIHSVDSKSLQVFTMSLILRGNPFWESDDGDEMWFEPVYWR